MVSSQRIIAADDTTLVPSITRAALGLVEHTATIIEVRSGEAALEEIRRGGVTLLITAFGLSDMSGFDLALKTSKVDSSLPIILLAGAQDPEIVDETQIQASFYYLVRSREGERFVHILRALLEGERPAEKEQKSEAPPTTDLGPIPEVDVAALSEPLSTILTEVGAMAVVLVDRQGAILQELGAVGYLDRDRLTETLAPNFANMFTIGPLVGGSRPHAMHFYDGDEFDIFALTVGFHHFICLIFEGSAGKSAFGSVTTYGRRAVQEMLKIIGDTAFKFQPVAAAPPPPPAPRATGKAAGKAAPAAASKPVEAPPPAKPAAEDYVPPRPPALEPLPEDADLEAMLAGLGKLDLAKADELFDPDKLAEIAAEQLAGERLTYEEAQQMGVLQR